MNTYLYNLGFSAKIAHYYLGFSAFVLLIIYKSDGYL